MNLQVCVPDCLELSESAEPERTHEVPCGVEQSSPLKACDESVANPSEPVRRIYVCSFVVENV